MLLLALRHSVQILNRAARASTVPSQKSQWRCSCCWPKFTAPHAASSPAPVVRGRTARCRRLPATILYSRGHGGSRRPGTHHQHHPRSRGARPAPCAHVLLPSPVRRGGPQVSSCFAPRMPGLFGCASEFYARLNFFRYGCNFS